MNGRSMAMRALLVGAFFAANGVAAAADSASTNAQEPPAQGAGGSDPDRMMQGGMGSMMRDHGGMMHDGGMPHGEGMMHGQGMFHGEGMMGHGMMGDAGPMSPIEMMHACGRMMNRGPMPGLPRLPPGNEKLQLQMQAEMMQKMGEILAKYAARLPDTPRTSP